MRPRVLLAVLLLLGVRALQADPQPPTGGESKSSPADVAWITFELYNVMPSSPFRFEFSQGRFVGDLRFAKETPESVRRGLQVKDRVLAFTPPAQGMAPGYAKIAFVAPMVFQGRGSGTLEAQAPMVAVINAGYGPVITQGGAFHLATAPLPPTCTLGCIADQICGTAPGSNCYLYDSTFMCCSVCPTGC